MPGIAFSLKRKALNEPRGRIELMKRFKTILMAMAATMILSVVPAIAQRVRTEVTNPQLAKKVRHELVTLPYYGVFDNLAYSISGDSVTLYGQVVRSTTRSDAVNRVRRLAGVSRVINNIELLPLSRFDNNLRLATYRAIARTAGLDRYLRGTNPSIHIVVNRGRVTLEGMVANVSDRNLANLAARGVSGSFSVTNNLRVEGNNIG